MKVGIPCMKCSLHPSQQMNSKTGKRAKTCGITSAWNEMNDERIGRDQTIDKDMTHLNVWMKGASDDHVEDIVQKEIDRINLARKEAGKRSLRQDAVSVVAIVEKPSIEYMKNLSYQERVDFLNQSHVVMQELIKEWNPNWKMIESVQHHDEFGGLSAHNHSLVMLSTIDKNGLPNMCAKDEFNLKFFNFVNKNYSKRMQMKGYGVEDVRTFDQLSEEEKQERKLNPREHGVDAYVYKQQQKESLDLRVKELEERVKVVAEAPDFKSYHDVLNENTELKKEINIKDKLIQQLSSELDLWKRRFESIKIRFESLSEKVGSRLMAFFKVNPESVIKNEFPSIELVQQVNDIQGRILERDPNSYRIIPSKQDINKFSIVYRQSSGKYEVVKDHFESRKQAESALREIKKIKSGITFDNEKIKETMKRR